MSQKINFPKLPLWLKVTPKSDKMTECVPEGAFFSCAFLSGSIECKSSQKDVAEGKRPVAAG